MAFSPGMAMRTCGYCGLRRAQMNVVVKNHEARRTDNQQISHTVLQCPDCANLTIIRHNGQLASPFKPDEILAVYPSDEDAVHSIRHLPERVEQYYSDARRVLDAGVPDAAAVQLRRTLEAAAAHFDVSEGTLFKSIEKLIQQGLVTTQFRGALDHIRAVGNLGAHASDERVDDIQAQHVLSFTTQLLRNLFEVPGDLLQIATSTSESPDDGDQPVEVVVIDDESPPGRSPVSIL